MRIYPVILCGGSGVRLWPASRPWRPKQFIPLLGDRSLFQDTALRMVGIEGAEAPLVVAGVAHAETIREQLRAIRLEAPLLLEPMGRDSGPAIAAAAAWIAGRDPDGVAVVVASDHHIPEAGAFQASVVTAASAAARGAIVTFGVRPTEPATAYGYIEAGERLDGRGEVRSVARFVEKPDAATAELYVAEGRLWNSGNFVFSARTVLDELRRHAPELLPPVEAALAEGVQDDGVLRLSPRFEQAPKISIDYALMERTDRAAVLPVDFAWSDLGAWDAAWAASPKDEDGNAVVGDVVLHGCRDSLVRSDGGLIVGVGLKGIGVVESGGSLLVCDLGAAQDVKPAFDRLKALGRREAASAPPTTAEALAQNSEELHRWLHTSALPLWWTLGADHDRGGFHEGLDLQGRPVGGRRRARVQARQTYVYAAAGLLGWLGPWRQAVDHGLDFFLTYYLRDDGLFRTTYDPDLGAEDRTTLYDQAFALFALANAAKVLPRQAPRLTAVAAGTGAALRDGWRGPHGAFRETFGPSPVQSNPHMHLLEAALALEDVSRDPQWVTLADDIVELAMGRFIDPEIGMIREYFEADCSIATGRCGRIVEPGHQFEWAWLLERWGVRRGDAAARTAARKLYRAGERGIDPGREAAVLTLLDDFSVAEPSCRLWPQTERLKAAHLLAQAPEGTGKSARELLRDAAAASGALLRFLDTPVRGVWFDHLEPDGTFQIEHAPASSFYHIVCALHSTVEPVILNP